MDKELKQSKRRWKCTVNPVFDDAGLVDDWLNMHRKYWFNNPQNGFYGYEDRAKSIAEYWLTNGEHGPDYNDPAIIRLMRYWDEYLEMFELMEVDCG